MPGDNGNKPRLDIINDKIKTLELDKETNKEELGKLYQERISLTPPPKDFKIAEIWIKDDTVALDAVPNFWMDKLRALGILEYCKEIVKDYNPVQKPNILSGKAVNSAMNKLNRAKNRIGGMFGGNK